MISPSGTTAAHTRSPQAGARWRRWLQRGAAAVVAAVAAYASYDHQWGFARTHGSADVAVVWPLSVDGLLVLSSLALLDPALRRARSWVRVVVRSAFVTGICVSLAANIAAAGGWDWAGVLVAGWPPVALLLAVEILIYSTGRDTITVSADVTVDSGHSRTPGPAGATDETISVTPDIGTGSVAPQPEQGAVTVSAATPGRRVRRGEAHRVMWEHYRDALADGRELTGAELDRIAGTRDYGRAVLARWRRTGRIPQTSTGETSRSTVDVIYTVEPRGIMIDPAESGNTLSHNENHGVVPWVSRRDIGAERDSREWSRSSGVLGRRSPRRARRRGRDGQGCGMRDNRERGPPRRDGRDSTETRSSPTKRTDN